MVVALNRSFGLCAEDGAAYIASTWDKGKTMLTLLFDRLRRFTRARRLVVFQNQCRASSTTSQCAHIRRFVPRYSASWSGPCSLGYFWCKGCSNSQELQFRDCGGPATRFRSASKNTGSISYPSTTTQARRNRIEINLLFRGASPPSRWQGRADHQVLYFIER